MTCTYGKMPGPDILSSTVSESKNGSQCSIRPLSSMYHVFDQLLKKISNMDCKAHTPIFHLICAMWIHSFYVPYVQIITSSTLLPMGNTILPYVWKKHLSYGPFILLWQHYLTGYCRMFITNVEWVEKYAYTLCIREWIQVIS